MIVLLSFNKLEKEWSKISLAKLNYFYWNKERTMLGGKVSEVMGIVTDIIIHSVRVYIKAQVDGGTINKLLDN
jgi:hypothetical protein